MPPHLLLVHEERNLRQVLKLHLVSAGYTVSAISRTEDIARELARRRTDLVLVDLALPYVEGIEFFVSEPDGRLIPAMFLTADEPMRTRAERLGAVACATQPLYADVFLGAVAGVLGDRGAWREVRLTRPRISASSRIFSIAS